MSLFRQIASHKLVKPFMRSFLLRRAAAAAQMRGRHPLRVLTAWAPRALQTRTALAGLVDPLCVQYIIR